MLANSVLPSSGGTSRPDSNDAIAGMRLNELSECHISLPELKIIRLSVGGMISLVLKGGEAAARRLAECTRLFALAESLGGVESLIELPAVMTHASTAGSPLAVEPGLVRLSVGLEHPDDLIEDLEQALRLSSR